MRLTTLFLLSSLFLILSCNTKSGDNSEGDSSIDLPSNNSIEPPATIEHLPPSKIKEQPTSNEQANPDYEKDFEAIVMGDGVRFREAPNRGSGVSSTGSFGELVHIVETSEDREVINDEPLCDGYGYHWYKTTGANDKEGWVFGKFLCVRPQIGQLFSTSMEGWISRFSEKEYSISGTNYRFDFAVDQSIGASDEDGLTGCDKMAFPFFYKADDKAIHFIRFTEMENFEGHMQSDRGFLQFIWDSEGGHDDLIAISFYEDEGSDKFEMKIKHYYQDGFSESIIVISENNGVFKMESASNSGRQE